MNYCNEHDAHAAQWIENLAVAGVIPPCVVDSRDIQKVTPDDLEGYSQAHFFAGIGGWPLALEMAGLSSVESIWSGSCPCQPFSNAGRRKGESDVRHLWPEFLRLIKECRPSIVVGEQVASRLGREWLAGVRADLEALGYAVGAADLCAAGVGAPHIRQRLFWVGDSHRSRLAGRASEPGNDGAELATAQRAGRDADAWSRFDVVPCLDGKSRRVESGSFPVAHGIPRSLGPLFPALGELGLDSRCARRIGSRAKRNRRIRLRGFGNAIVPDLAAEFLLACRDIIGF